jgi:arginyl-tRNA synthetase
MNIKQNIQSKITEIIAQLYGIEGVTLEVQKNKTEFEGDFTIVIFPLVKQAKKVRMLSETNWAKKSKIKLILLKTSMW